MEFILKISDVAKLVLEGESQESAIARVLRNLANSVVTDNAATNCAQGIRNDDGDIVGCWKFATARQFTLYWLSGERQLIDAKPDQSFTDAFRDAGYGTYRGPALDFYAHGNDDKYIWNKSTRTWDLKTPMKIG